MKIICAWCRVITGYRCDHCGEKLLHEKIGDVQVLVCRNGLTPIVHVGTEFMHVSHGMCEACRKLTHEQRDDLARRQTE